MIVSVHFILQSNTPLNQAVIITVAIVSFIELFHTLRAQFLKQPYILRHIRQKVNQSTVSTTKWLASAF